MPNTNTKYTSNIVQDEETITIDGVTYPQPEGLTQFMVAMNIEPILSKMAAGWLKFGGTVDSWEGFLSLHCALEHAQRNAYNDAKVNGEQDALDYLTSIITPSDAEQQVFLRNRDTILERITIAADYNEFISSAWDEENSRFYSKEERQAMIDAMVAGEIDRDAEQRQAIDGGSVL